MGATATTPPSARPGRGTSGQQLGPYKLVKLLGEGGMARVYLAEDTRDGKRCALKRLHATHFADRLTIERFLAEARAVSGIRHRNLLEIYEILDEPGDICLVMEYLEGRDLARVLRAEGPFDPERAARLCAQAADALYAVHKRHVIHRDLKPDNLFLHRDSDGRERIKLLDFGVARLGDVPRPHSLKTKSGQTVGTPKYMSPEQATASELDARSDIYMLGVVLFELVTGRPPFAGKGYGSVMLQHVHEAPPRPSSLRADVPAWLEAVILRCLAKDPEVRYASAKELAAALRGEPTAENTLPIARVDAGIGWSARTWTVLLVVALLVGAGLAAAAIAWSH